MESSSHAQRNDAKYPAVFLWLALGAFVLAGAVAPVLVRGMWATFTLPAAVVFIGWGVELLVYTAVAWFTTPRQLPGLLLPVGLGVLLRVVISAVTALLLQTAHLNAVILGSGVFGLPHGWAMLCTALALAFPLRRMLAPYLIVEPPAPSGNDAAKFSFSPRKTAAPVSSPVVCPDCPPPAEVRCLQPPPGFTAVKPLEGVARSIEVPASVILASLPDAPVSADASVAIPLALVLPQLASPTVWLTRQQLFPQSSETDGAACWIAIPARYYVPQLPRSAFVRTGAAPSWLQLPVVPQEDEFILTSTEEALPTARSPREDLHLGTV